ncbi:hypothetical protein [Methylobacterium sp. J-068]|uniref:hypothetical protein n=1 Tax=Methylobacterium sp. J-068 TaxID=2836649 RepID=UPI001FB8E43D|nr:hypothetical protein [Methylobacterium sp. J-068]MCJ2033132.1 hypothetical protein [Methylobacterium sp. J-068]
MRSSANPKATTAEATTAEVREGIGAARPIHATRRSDRTFVEPACGSALSGILTLLFLVCALIPLLHVAGDVPRGFEIRPVLAQSARPPISEAATRVSSTTADVDDVYEDVAPLRITVLTALRSHRPASPPAVGALRTMAAARLDRPPRLAAIG